MTIQAGTRLGAYEILSPIGAGGMGEVYRARDTRIDRPVALKVLPEEFLEGEESRARFEREARSLASLNHPNIAVLYSFEEIPGPSPSSSSRHILVMELLEGATLREKLDSGPVPPKQAVDYALQIAKGLSAAHEKGIVHRDLKPENLFVSKDGHLKILDFGLAKRTEEGPGGEKSNAPTESRHTEPGVVMGTVGYMSPEQVRGLPVDHRSDVFSFGAILYELLSGKRAFKRETPADTMSAILKEEPPELSESGRNIPPALDHVVKHCLEKERNDRFQSAKDVMFALSEASGATTAAGGAKAPTPPSGKTMAVVAVAAVALLAFAGILLLRRSNKSAPAAAGPKRIVVLPFENLGSPEDAYFASGMTEEITSRLAGVRNLAVLSRTTATQYDRKGKTVEQIGKDLGVGYVLEGSVRWDRSGGGTGRVRITPQLIRVSDDTHLWTDRYDRQLADVFAIQTEVASGVVRALDLALTPADAAAPHEAPTRDLAAYDFYLRALALERRRQEASVLAEQIKLAEAAVERDPQFAEALSLLARARIINYWLFYDRRPSELERARTEAERAVALRPDSAETHMAYGSYKYQVLLDYEAALVDFKKALALRPNDAAVQFVIGAVHRRQGKMEDAEAGIRKGIDLDPGNGTFYFNLGETQILARKYAEAARSLEASASLNPGYADGYFYAALTQLLWRGDVAAADRALEAAARVAGLQDPGGRLDSMSVRIAICRRDWERAQRRLDATRREAITDQLQYIPVSLLRAEVLDDMGRRDAARAAYAEAAGVLRAKVKETPEDGRLHSSLGIALAGLGQNAEAVRAGERGVELMPPTRDAFRGVSRVEDMARIQAMVGNQEAATRELEFLLSHPSWISAPLLKLDPRWDALRQNPSFQKLVAGK
ncbi:MAG: protein kinase [Acidobacteria bacterium]|nr:protein kinase [Acidobacteriota bacterium]